MKRNNLRWDSKSDIQKLVHSLKGGNVSIGTSDTVLGFIAPVTQQGFLALNALKERYEKPYLILIGSQFCLWDYISQGIDEDLRAIMATFWPGPLTLVLPAKDTIPGYMRSPEGTIAVRMPKHTGLQDLLAELPMVFSTSANKAGKPVPSALQDVDPAVLNAVSYCILDDDTMHLNTVPSTILDCTQKQFKIVRQGAISKEELQKVCSASIL